MKWLFLVYQIQTSNSKERVKVWRATKKIGAVLFRNSVYVLPYSKERLEDFQWLCQQIIDSKGEASIFITDTDRKEDDNIKSLFIDQRNANYEEVFKSSIKLSERVKSIKKDKLLNPSTAKRFNKEVEQLYDEYQQIYKIDFFGSSIRLKTQKSLNETRLILSSTLDFKNESEKTKRYYVKDYKNKVWATRIKIHIDRLSTAWLINRFIDNNARFLFKPETELPKNALIFDAFGVEFGHKGDDCTFENMMKSFNLNDRGLEQIAEIVHDVDLKDKKFNRPEAPGIDVIVRCLSSSANNDHEMLKTGFPILDALYKYFNSLSVYQTRQKKF